MLKPASPARVLIVDDEPPARDKLRRLLERQRGIGQLAEARDGIEALEMVASFKPDLVFLDIQMPEVSGIELAASLPEPAPLIVFATAYDQYAVEAFDANAVDYLLKPYDEARLQRTLERVALRLASAAAGHAVATPQSGQPVHQLLVTERGVTRVIRVDEVQWIETADNYVVLHTASGSPLLRQTLAGLLDKLGPGFARCHRRAAVQLQWIERLVTLDKGDAELLLRGGAVVPCSRQYRAAIVDQL
jgi:two-component system LytT family response regulator